MTLEKYISITKALSDAQRIRAFMALRDGELCACQIIELLSLAPSTVSKHMLILKQAGLIDSRKDSRWVYYRMRDNAATDVAITKIAELTIDLLQLDNTICKDQAILQTITANKHLLLCKNQNCK